MPSQTKPGKTVLMSLSYSKNILCEFYKTGHKISNSRITYCKTGYKTGNRWIADEFCRARKSFYISQHWL